MKKTKLLALAFGMATVVSGFAGIGAVNVTGTATQVMAASAGRSWFIIQNTGTNDVWLKMDSSGISLTTTNGFRLAAGASINVSSTPKFGLSRNAITAITSGPTNTVIFQEGEETP